VLLKDVRVRIEDSCCWAKAAASRSPGAPGTRPHPPLHAHHRTAEVALEKMCRRLLSRKAFGKYISDHSVWEERVAEARINIEMCRLLCLKAADMMDKAGNKSARLEIAMIKVAAPTMALKIIDDAIQATAAPGSPPTSASPAPTPASAPCAWPTVPTRSTPAPSRAWSSASTRPGLPAEGRA